MKSVEKLITTTSLLLVATPALTHPGHEAIGDVLHIEYLAVVVLVGVIGLAVWRKKKRDKDA